MTALMEPKTASLEAPSAKPGPAPVAPRMPGESHLRAETFSVYYGKFEAVCGVTCAFPKGEVSALIGPSGCGKSTFLRAVNRMNDLIPSCRTAGLLEFDGQSIYGPKLDVTVLRKRIGMVFQKPNPFPKSIFDNVAYGPRANGVRDRAKLAEIVERSLRAAALWDEVKDDLSKSALELSGGQQQRLCIARALAVEPEVILMDEPASALDPVATLKIEELIRELRKNYTIVIVTHNMQQAARVSDYTAFFMMDEEDRAGYLVEYGPTDRIFTNPQHDMTERYITGRFG